MEFARFRVHPALPCYRKVDQATAATVTNVVPNVVTHVVHVLQNLRAEVHVILTVVIAGVVFQHLIKPVEFFVRRVGELEFRSNTLVIKIPNVVTEMPLNQQQKSKIVGKMKHAQISTWQNLILL